METGESIYASKHSEFLNELLDKNYKNFMQCTLNLHNGYMIWMLKFNTGESKEGWTNTIINGGNTIIEDYTGNPLEKLVRHRTFDSTVKRLVFNVFDNGTGREYKFCGVFACDSASNNNRRIWNKVADSYSF